MKKTIVLPIISALIILGIACEPGQGVGNPRSGEKIDKSKKHQFPFPAPKPTKYKTKKIKEISKAQLIEDLKKALGKAGFEQDDYRYFSANDDFAIVTEIEQINGKGERLKKDLQERDVGASSACPGRSYLNCLVSGKRFYYRSLAFIISNNSPLSTETSPEFKAVLRWFEENGVPASPQTKTAEGEEIMLGENFELAAFIYIFEYHTGTDEISFMTDFDVSVISQLKLLDGNAFEGLVYDN